MTSLFNRPLTSATDPDKAAATRARETGFNDGYARRRARSLEASYQQAWRKGREARERDDNDAA